ncbi:L10-interacting MYB domain-containing protein-like [Vicia villosa]|uniref:L10-interacting MYB domain-containing protein-like n=1 Tax=Vicia villosa TaxID=3911 RepID=UPI00273BD383|nr:L10-interacting MYB domain-containing protein-like [Vicia villosa]
MASSKDKMEATKFKWTTENEKIFCDICIKFIRKNGRGSFKWKEISKEFEVATNIRCLEKSLKNKFDFMKSDWRIWKFLKFGETGLGSFPVTGKLSCSNEWWDRKIKEKPEAKKFRNKSIDPSIEEYWNQLFDDSYASGEEVVAPSVNPDFVELVALKYLNKVLEAPKYQAKVLEIHNQTNVLEKHKYRVKLKGAAKLGCQIETLISQSHKALEIMQFDDDTSKQVNGSSTIATAMSIINRMVMEGVLEKGSELWCFAACLVENETRREIFLNMEDDESRKIWLTYMHSKEK